MKDNENVKKLGGMRRLKMGGYSIGLIIIVIAAAVLVNMIVGSLPSKYTKFELTGFGLYNVSDQSKKLLSSLDRDITVYFVSSEGNRNPQLESFLDRYAELSDRVKVVDLDPNENPQFVSDNSVTSENSLVVMSDLRSRTILYDDIFEYSADVLNEYYSNYSYTMYGIPIEQVYSRDVFDADNEITSAIDYVTTDNLPVAYSLTGHGEIELSDIFTDFIKYNNIELGTLNLLTAKIPDNTGVILINNPSGDIGKNELETLTSYIDGGGKIVMVTDVTSYSTEEHPNLTALAEHCGMTAKDGVVLEPEGSSRYNHNRFNLIESLESTEITSIFQNPASIAVYMPRSHAIVEYEDYEGSMKVKPIIKTSADAYIIGSDESERDRTDDDETGEFYLGAISSNRQNGASFVWYSCSLINAEEAYTLYGVPSNLNVYASSISTICEKPATVTVDSVHTNANEHLMINETNRTILTVAIQYVAPITLLVAGIVVWIIRRLR